MDNVLITGAAGFIGRNLVPYLEDDYNVFAIDKEKTYFSDKVRFYQTDLGLSDYLDIFNNHKIYAVIHLAAEAGVPKSIADPGSSIRENVLNTFFLMLSAKNMGVEKFINASSGGVLDIRSPYIASKAAVEAYCQAFMECYNFPIVNLRFSNVYGPFCEKKSSVVAAYLKASLKERVFELYGNGNQRRDFLFVQDLCAGIRKAITTDYTGTVQLASGNSISLNALLDKINHVTGKEVEIRRAKKRKGDIESVQYSIQEAKNLLNWIPNFSLNQGIEETWSWMIENQNLVD